MKSKKELSQNILSICSFFIYIQGDNMKSNENEKKSDIYSQEDEEDLRRFLRGGFGAKWARGSWRFFRNQEICSNIFSNFIKKQHKTVNNCSNK